MRIGGFPGQQEALLQVMKNKQRLTRRRWMAASAGALAAGAGAGFAGGRATRSSERPSERAAQPTEDRWLQAIDLPLEQLAASAPTFLAALSQQERIEPSAWFGVARLVCAIQEEHPAVPERIARSIVRFARRRDDIPAHLKPGIELLARRYR